LFFTISAKLRAADPAFVYLTEADAILSGSLVAKAAKSAFTLLVCLVVKFGSAFEGASTIVCVAMNIKATNAFVSFDIFTSYLMGILL
jgi:hypothetical protein